MLSYTPEEKVRSKFEPNVAEIIHQNEYEGKK